MGAFRVNQEVYTEYGYELVEIPPAVVQTRADFILNSIGNSIEPGLAPR
jgi:predicted ATPase